jgi:hypothetical protein
MKKSARDKAFDDAPFRIFEERKLELLRSKRAWRNWFLATIILLLGVTVFTFIGLASSIPFTVALWMEVALGLPLIYAAIFFHAQHNREREFLEEYSFKSVVARSLEGYKAVLKKEVNSRRPDEQKKFLEFLIASAKDLQMPPRAIISKHPIRSEEDVKIGLIENLTELVRKFIPK